MTARDHRITPAYIAARWAGDHENAMVASTSGGIEAQEKRGQSAFVAGETLPIDGTSGEARQRWLDLGVTFGDDVDDLFVEARLPEGWHKEPTDHSMWSDLFDGNGKRVAQIFYKAAFYDRRAFIGFEAVR